MEIRLSYHVDERSEHILISKLQFSTNFPLIIRSALISVKNYS